MIRLDHFSSDKLGYLQSLLYSNILESHQQVAIKQNKLDNLQDRMGKVRAEYSVLKENAQRAQELLLMLKETGNTDCLIEEQQALAAEAQSALEQFTSKSSFVPPYELVLMELEIEELQAEIAVWEKHQEEIAGLLS